MKKTMLIIAGLVVVVVVLFVNALETTSDGYSIGSVVADFKLPSTSGKQVSLADYGDAKGYIVVFTCNTCPYAKLYEQRIIELDKKYKAKGFPVVAINPNDVNKQPGDSMKEMSELAQKKSYSFPYLRDDAQVVTKTFGATKTPHVYVLNKTNGKILVEYIGAIDDSPREEADVQARYVEQAVEALLAGRKPEITEQRAIGCTIKWKDI